MTRLLLALSLVALWPAMAFAASLPNIDLASCSQGVPDYMVTTGIVTCVQTSIIQAAALLMNGISTWMTPIMGAMFTVSVVLVGIRIASGEHGAARHAVPLTIKLALLTSYSYMLGDITSLCFMLMDTLAVLGGGGTPWGMVDSAIQSMLGYGPSLKLYQGLIGLVIASLFSGTIGIAVFLAGVLAVLSLLRCFGRLIFVYLSAYVVVGFMAAVSPMFIPMLVFQTTDRYFRQWLNITMSAIILPMMLFAVMSMFIGIFPIMINGVFNVTGGNDFRAIWRWDTPLMGWLNPSDPQTQEFVENQPDSEPRRRAAAVPSFMSPLLADAPDMNIYKVPSIDFGWAHITKMQQLLSAFIALMIFCMLMKTLVEIIPGIAEDITASAIGLGDGKTPLEARADQAMSQVASGLQNSMGSAPTPPPRAAPGGGSK